MKQKPILNMIIVERKKKTGDVTERKEQGRTKLN